MRLVRFFISGLFLLSCASASPAATISKSTLDDQKEVEVTVYNSNFGLVKDIREINFPSGEGELRFMDVAAQILPETVSIHSLSAPEEFGVLEQNYEYDLINETKLLDKYVGKDIKLVSWNEYQDRKETVEAQLISNNNGQVYQIGKEIYVGYPGYKVLPELPENLIAQPTLTWLYKNTSKKPHRLEVSYLTNYISWKADYVVALNAEDTFADISGWVSLDNNSGAIYKDARLKLVAGEVHRAAQVQQNRYDRMEAKMVMASEAGFVENPFFEYHIYDLQHKTTIKDKQTKQIRLLDAEGVGIIKKYMVQGTNYYYTSRYTVQDPKQPVNVWVEFKNSQDNHLGMPLPAGIMRLYKKDPQGSLQFIGEDRIEHTPKDEKIELQLGEAFDVVAERIQTDFKVITSRMYETAWQITLRNHKETDVTVTVIESLQGDWNIIERSHPFEKLDAYRVRFDVSVPKDKEVKLTYRVRVSQ